MHILVVEDDHLLNNTLCYNLNAAGYKVDSALCKQEAENYIEKQWYELIVLDVFFLTANDMESDMLKGYELGADDYVTKPFPMSVFQKKLAALLSRIAKQSEEDKYNDGTFAIDFKEMTASLEGKALVFTPLEYRLLKIFTKNPQNVLTRQMLLERLWDIDEHFVDEHALTVAVSRVRSKIETNGQQYIKTVYGMGYMWVGGVQK